MPRRSCKRDANHDALTDIGRRIGFYVLDTWQFAQYVPGFPDAMWLLDGVTVLVEYKSASGRLTPDEESFRDTWPGPYVVVRSEWDAVALREKLLNGEKEITY